MNLSPSVILLVTLCFSLLPATAPANPSGANLLNNLSKQAQTYARRLAQDQTANYRSSELAKLRAVSDLLSKRRHCSLALATARQAISGLDHVRAYSWRRIAKAAICTSNWQAAVAAAWLMVDGSTERRWRQQSLLLLGSALEGHKQYGTRYALAAYQKALTYGYSRIIANKVVSLEQKLATAEALRIQRMAAVQALRIDRTFVQTDSVQPAICLDFSADVPNPTQQRYGDFLRFSPPFKAQFRKTNYNDEICADGAAFGTTYQVHVLPGLVANSGIKIPKALQYKIAVENRQATLWFGNSRYVLPLGGGVPLHGINTKRAGLTLYKVVDRNLLQEEVRSMFRTDLNSWKAQRIRDELGEQVWQGEADLVVNINQETVTNLPIAAKTPQEPGVYILTAVPLKPDETTSKHSSDKLAALWLLVSDIGITSYQGTDGLTLVTRSLATGKPLTGVRLSLYARNNRLLGEARSNGEGLARLPAEILGGAKL